MRRIWMREFGERLRTRIKGAGFSNISGLLRDIRINHGFVTALRRGDQDDAGLLKVAKIAIMLGLRPSELVADLDEQLLNPAPLAAEDIRRLGFAQPPEAYDPFRLALVLDVVLDWDAEANETSDKSLLVDLVDGLYDEIVRPDPRGITPLQVRRRAMARVFGLDLPEPAEHPRRRGRPASPVEGD